MNQESGVEYVVAYAKIIESKDGINLDGVFFGGVSDDIDKADKIARDCVNYTKGGTVLPKVLPISGSYQIIEALYDATDNFEKITEQMREADKTIRKTQRRKKK